MDSIRFGELPPRGTPKRRQFHNWPKIISQLDQSPGEWALIVSGTHSSVAARINSGTYEHFPKGRYEAACRNMHRNADGKVRFDVWARRIAPEEV